MLLLVAVQLVEDALRLLALETEEILNHSVYQRQLVVVLFVSICERNDTKIVVGQEEDLGGETGYRATV